MKNSIFDKIGGLAGLIMILTVILSIAFLGILIYSRKDDLKKSEEELVDYAVDLGMDREKFIADFDSDAIRDRVDEEKKDASRRLNDELATPAIFIEGEKFNLTALESLENEIIRRLAEDLSAAPIYVEIFSDFNCGHCAELDPLTYQIEEQFTDQVTIERKNLPFLKESSYQYAYAAMAAKEQGMYDEMSKKLFSEIHGTEYGDTQSPDITPVSAPVSFAPELN